MANERIGLAYEALAREALQAVIRREPSLGSLFEQVTPPGFTVKTDFVIGKDVDSPRVLILVTHSGSRKDSSRKYWRNLAEFFEAKFLGAKCATINLYFSREDLKPDVVAIQRAIFDDLIIAPDESFFSRVDACARELAKGSADITPERVHALDKSAHHAVDAFAKLLADRVTSALKKSEESIAKARAILNRMTVKREARVTSFARGMAKLLLFPNPSAALSAAAKPRPVVQDDNMPPKEAGLTTTSLVGNTINDPAIAWLAKTIDSNTVSSLVKSPDVRVLDKYRAVLLSLPDVDRQLSWLGDHWKALSDPATLLRGLRESHEKPSMDGVRNQYSWLYYLVVEALKQNAGRRQGFGLSVLLRDIEAQRAKRGYRDTLGGIVGRSVSVQDLRAVRSIERLISVQLFDRSSPGSAGLFKRYDVDMAEVAIALAKRISSVDSKVVARSRAPDFRAGIFQLQFECNLASPKGYDYLAALLAKALSDNGLSGVVKSMRGALVERALAEGASLRADSGVTEVLIVGSTVVHCQSVTKKGIDHKRKELAARATSIRLTWDGRQFVERPGVEKLILLADGDWDDESLQVAQAGGWNEIYYPDEMDELVKAIV